MCPYCQKRFKSKATCRIHFQIHKTEWVKQFKEQLKSGTIQFEEDDTSGQTNNESVTMSTNNDGLLDSLSDGNSDLFHGTVQRTHEDNNQILFTNLVQETQMDDSGNQFEYFLLLPSNGDANSIATDGSEQHQFVVNDEQLNFGNLQFIQLDQSALLELHKTPTQTVPLMTNYRLNDNDLNQAEIDYTESLVPVPEPTISTNSTMSTESSNQILLTNETSAKSHRKSTKSINKCETCSKIFQKPIDLRRHIRTHTLEKVKMNSPNCHAKFN